VPILKVLHADVQETACATPVQANIFVPEPQQHQPMVQPSIPNDVAASQAAPDGIALPKDQLNPSFLDPQQPSPVVTPDQLLERPGCDSQQAGILVIMQQPDSSLADQVQTSTSLVPADDHSPATTRPAVFADLPSNSSDMLVNSPNGRGVSSISKPPRAAQSKGSPASNAAATASEQQSPPAEPAAATASEQQSPPAEPAAATASEQQSPPAQPAAAMASEQQSPPAEPAAATASEQQSPPAEPAAATASEQHSPPAEPAAATASEQQSPPAEPAAAGLVSSAQANCAFGSSAMPTSSNLCAALPPGIAALADKLASSQGDLESALLGPLATEVTLAAQGVRTTKLSSALASAA